LKTVVVCSAAQSELLYQQWLPARVSLAGAASRDDRNSVHGALDDLMTRQAVVRSADQ